MGKGIFCIPGVTMYARFDILAISKYDNARLFFFLNHTTQNNICFKDYEFFISGIFY